MANTVCRISPACWHRGPRGVAPERMPKADATELAPKKIGYTLRHGDAVPEGSFFPTDSFLLLPWIERVLRRALDPKAPIFFGEAPERRPWATKREDRPAAFAGRSFLRF